MGDGRAEALLKALRSEEVTAYHAVTKAFMMLAGPTLPQPLADVLTEVKDVLHISESRHAAEETAALLSPDVLAVIAARGELDADGAAAFTAAPKRKRRAGDDGYESTSSTEDDTKLPLRPHSSKKARRAHPASAGSQYSDSHTQTGSLSTYNEQHVLQGRVAALQNEIAALTNRAQMAADPRARKDLEASVSRHQGYLAALLKRIDVAAVTASSQEL
eukprot:TRINITY_DN12746_c0_g1_i1.p1 TRINITY_DN12746_c0_g1~~TRINITY_DN12746_c0_g1_i1.p1  ORF type:complete len:218 (+),score=82.84 TRINITY_DN12746_c0_g1_i1:44-697(+)